MKNTEDDSGIDVNLPLIRKVIAEYERELLLMRRLEAAILDDDEELRMQILHEAGFQDPELFPEAKS